MLRLWVVSITTLLLITACGTQSNSSAEDAPYTLEETYYFLQAVDDMEARGVLSEEVAASQGAYYLDFAESITGETLTEAELGTYLFDSDAQSWLRFLNFVNLIWVFASILIVLSSVWIFVKYVLPVLKRIPIVVYEILLYLLCAGFIFGGLYVELGIRQFVALPGVLGLFFLLPFSYAQHIAKIPFKQSEVVDPTAKNRVPRQKDLKNLRRDMMLQYLVLTVIWGAISVAYESVLIGGLTVLVMMATLGFLPMITPHLVKGMGFKRYDPGATVMLVSLVLVIVFLTAESLGIAGIYAAVFEPGVFWIGTDVYFAALAVLAVRWYHRDKPKRYLIWQAVSIISGVGALFIGAWWDIPVIQEIGGTYLLIYVLEKYIEMHNWRKHWAWAMLGLGIILYLVVLVINTYPQFFLFAA